MSGTGLVYHAGGLGDFVLSLPAIFRVVQVFPGLSWRYWGPSDRLALLPGFALAPPALLAAGHTLWGDRPDPAARGALLACGAALALGGSAPPPWARGGGPNLLPLASFPGAGGPAVPVFQSRQLDALGVPRIREPWLPAWRDSLLGRRLPAEIVVHPGSGDRKKNLPEEGWWAVLEALRRRTGLPARVLLGPAERERGAWGGGAGAARCGSLADLLGALGRAALFLGNDSGPSHLAALLGVPAVVAFGPSDPRIWHPWGPRVRVVAARLPCAPCTAGGPIACEAPRCLGDPLAGRLVGEAAALLARTGPLARPTA